MHTLTFVSPELLEIQFQPNKHALEILRHICTEYKGIEHKDVYVYISSSKELLKGV